MWSNDRKEGFMDSVLKNMEAEKRDKIINAAIEEFATYPYEKASTNNIVKNAGISKGLLFHYFGSKQELYDKLVGFVLNKLVDDITAAIDWEESDLLNRIKQLIVAKMRIGRIYPNMFDFVIKVMSHSKVKNADSAINLYKKYGIDAEKLFRDVYSRNIDFSKFKDTKNIDKSLNIIRWTLEKYSEEQMLNIDKLHVADFQRILDDMDEYINVLRKAFY